MYVCMNVVDWTKLDLIFGELPTNDGKMNRHVYFIPILRSTVVFKFAKGLRYNIDLNICVYEFISSFFLVGRTISPVADRLAGWLAANCPLIQLKALDRKKKKKKPEEAEEKP